MSTKALRKYTTRQLKAEIHRRRKRGEFIIFFGVVHRVLKHLPNGDLRINSEI